MVELLLDINAELLHGCKFACPGCAVETEGQNGWQGDDGRRVHELALEFQSRGYKLNFFNITPTDYMTASNTLEVLQDPYVRKMAHMFKAWFLQCTMMQPIDEHQKEIAKIINLDYKDTRLCHYLIFSAPQIDNERYMQNMVERKNRLVELYNQVQCHRQFAIFNWYPYKEEIEKKHLNFVELTKWFRKNFNANHDYALSFARAHDLQGVRDEFVQGVGWLNQLISAKVPLDSDMDRDDIEFFMPDRVEQNPQHFYSEAYDFLNRRYSYRNGEFYWVPFLIACLVNFDEGFRMPLKEWTVDEFERCEQEMIINQYQSVPEHCNGCEHIGKCAERQIIQTLNIIDHDECIAPLIQYDGQYKEWNNLPEAR